jgi:hypothetical protein
MNAVKVCEGLKNESAVECMKFVEGAENSAIILSELDERLAQLLGDLNKLACERYGNI